jgi:hypothetical protein
MFCALQVVAGIDEDAGLRAGGAGQSARPCPSRRCRCDRRPARRACIRRAGAGRGRARRGRRAGLLRASSMRLRMDLRAGIVGAVGEPEGDVAGAELALAISMESRTCASAWRGSRRSGLQSEPNLYSWSWKRLGLMEPAGRRSGFESLISGHREAVGQIPEHVQRRRWGCAGEAMFTWPASANFSSRWWRAAWANLPKRVPVLAKPQEGTSIYRGPSRFFVVGRLRACGFSKRLRSLIINGGGWGGARLGTNWKSRPIFGLGHFVCIA